MEQKMAKFDPKTKLTLAVQHLEAAKEFTSKTKIEKNLDHAIEKMKSAKRILHEIEQNGHSLGKIKGDTPAEVVEALILGFESVKNNIGFAGFTTASENR
jgi:hypothetical protein